MLERSMRCLPKAGASLIGLFILLAGIAGCATGPDRTQEFLAAENALSSRYDVPGPGIVNRLDSVGTDESTTTAIAADSPERITLISATLIALPGFRTPRLVSIGIVPVNCRQMFILHPPVNGHPSVVTFNGHPFQPLPLRGYNMEIGAGCTAQIIYVVREKSTGQYVVGGLRVLLRYDSRTQVMYAYNGTDIWYYDSTWLPTGRQVTDGLQATFAAQVALYRSQS